MSDRRGRRQARSSLRLAASSILACLLTIPCAQAQGSSDEASADPQAIEATTGSGGVRWNRGAPVLSSDGGMWIKPLVQVIFDGSATGGSSDPAANVTRTGARALHLGVAGGSHAGLAYQFETELVDGDVNILWAYIGWSGRIGGQQADVLLGNFQNDRGVEGASGGEALPFVEANVVASALAPARGDFGLGVMGRLVGEGWHASLAVTGDDIDATPGSNDRRVFQARAHVNPIRGEVGTIHLGAWGYDEALSGTATLGRGIRIAHGLNEAAIVASSALADARGDRGYGVELGGTSGRFWVMGEAGRRDIRLPAGTRERQNAASLSAGYFITATPAYYDSRTGTFGRPRPATSVFEGGAGAVELTARYQRLDMGRLPGAMDGTSATLGVNWYLNDFIRVMANATRWSRTQAGDRDSGSTAALRAQLAF